ncbi:MAG: PAS domain S-box protein, partial [Pseudomonadales bacterium]|nr:PAS domain S-box protein [Pseudomonadales bacterium]
MAIADALALALVFFILTCGVLYFDAPQKGVRYVVAGWFALLLAVTGAADPTPLSLQAFMFAVPRTLVPILFWFSSLAYRGNKPDHRYLLPGLIVGLTMWLAPGWQLDTLGLSLAGPFNLLIFSMAGWVLVRPDPKVHPTRIEYALAMTYAGLGVHTCWGALARAQSWNMDYYLLVWAALAAVIAALQIGTFLTNYYETGESLRRSHAEARHRIRRMGSRLEAIVSNSSELILELTLEGDILYASPNVERITGYTQEELLGRNLFEAMHQDDLNRIPEWTRNAEAGVVRLNPAIRIRNKAGEWRWFESTSTRYLHEDGEMRAVVTGRDISLLLNQTRDMLILKTRFDTLSRRSLAMIFEFDAGGRLTYMSPAAVDFTGYEEAPWLGRSYRELARHLRMTPHHDLPTVPGLIRGFQSEDGNLMTQKITTASGATRYIEADTSTHTLYGQHQRILVVVRDVSERVAMEQVIQKNRFMNTLGTIASGVAHDFNNLLAIILGYTELSQQELEAGQVRHLKDRLAVINSAGTQASGLTAELLTYAGKGTFNKVDLDLRALLQEAETLLRANTDDEVNLTIQAPEHPVIISADPV